MNWKNTYLRFIIQTTSILLYKMSSVNFTPSDLGEASSFKPDSHRGPIFVWTRPTPAQQNSWNEKFPEQVGTNKDGKIVPLKDFDIYDILSGFMSSKEISLLMEEGKNK